MIKIVFIYSFTSGYCVGEMGWSYFFPCGCLLSLSVCLLLSLKFLVSLLHSWIVSLCPGGCLLLVFSTFVFVRLWISSVTCPLLLSSCCVLVWSKLHGMHSGPENSNTSIDLVTMPYGHWSVLLHTISRCLLWPHGH